MASFMFDTNMCIYLMKEQPAVVAMRFLLLSVGDVVMSALTYAELEHGVTVSPQPQQAREALMALTLAIEVVPFDAAAGTAYGPVRHASGRTRSAINKLIAAHAISLGLTLVTNNERDFQDYPGLKVENWVAAESGSNV